MELWVRWGKKPTPCQVGQTEWDPVTVLGVPNEQAALILS